MWYVKSFTGSFCLCISMTTLLYNISFLYNDGGFYLLPVLSLICLLNITLHSPGCVSTRAICVKEPTEKQSILLEKYAPEKHGHILQPPHAHYSYVVNAVVLDYDHFCLWSNNAIGLLNIRYFIQFLFWTSITCVYTFIYILNYVYHCSNGNYVSCAWLRWHDAESTMNILFSFLFGIFTTIMLTGQIYNLKEGLNSVDKAKGVDDGRYGSFYRFFGSYTPIGWYFPTPNSSVLYEHGRKSVSKCATILEDNDIKIIYK